MISQTDRRSASTPHGWRAPWVALLAALLAPLAGAALPQKGQSPVRVTVKDEQPVVVDATLQLPVDPAQRIQFHPQGLTPRVLTMNNQTLHLGHYATLKIDNQVFQGAAAEYQNRALAKGKDGKARQGFESRFNYGNGLTVTVTMMLVATKPANKAAKRSRDSVLTHYVIENKGTKPRSVGLRIFMDTYIINNDGCLFAAPNHPNKILNGVELKGKELPPYVQLLQQPNLQNPGFVAHLTLDLGPKLDKPDRVVLTNLGAQRGQWDVAAQPAGDSALAVFWEPKEIKPGGKREIAYGYGQGLVPSPESEGRVELALGGSFVPGKRFTVTAYVNDPAPGQSLTLDLPAGMALVDSPEVQAVPAPPANGAPVSLVMWRARVLRPGEFAVRVRSSTGVTQGKLVTVTQEKE